MSDGPGVPSPNGAPGGAAGAAPGGAPGGAAGGGPNVRIMPRRAVAAAGAADPAAGRGPVGTGADGGPGENQGRGTDGTIVTSVINRPIEQEMRQAFLDYAMSVI